MLSILPQTGQRPLPGIKVKLAEVAAICNVSLGVGVDVCILPERASSPGLSFSSASTFTRTSFFNFGSALTCACVSAQSFDFDQLLLITDFLFLSPLGLSFIMAKTILSETAENSSPYVSSKRAWPKRAKDKDEETEHDCWLERWRRTECNPQLHEKLPPVRVNIYPIGGTNKTPKRLDNAPNLTETCARAAST